MAAEMSGSLGLLGGFAPVLHEHLDGVGKAAQREDDRTGNGDADTGLRQLAVFRLGHGTGGRAGLIRG